MARRSSEARKLARDLQNELDQHAEEHGVVLAWTVPEQATIETIQDQIDRKTEILAPYENAEDEKPRLKLSAEARHVWRPTTAREYGSRKPMYGPWAGLPGVCGGSTFQPRTRSSAWK